jgi:hypothetical protein
MTPSDYQNSFASQVPGPISLLVSSLLLGLVWALCEENCSYFAGTKKRKMKVIDIADQHNTIYFQCLEDWSDEIKEADDHKEIGK